MQFACIDKWMLAKIGRHYFPCASSKQGSSYYPGTQWHDKESNTQHGMTGGQRKMLLTCNLSLSYAKLPLKQLSVQACHDLFENIDASCQEWKLSFKPIKWKNYIHYVFTSLQCIFCNCQFNQTATSNTDCKMMYAPVFG